MAKPAERDRARRLRRELGWSLRRIAAEVGVSLSTASLWVRDLDAPPVAGAETRDPHGPQSHPHSCEHADCSRCKRKLPVTSFNRYRDGRQSWCRACFRAYYAQTGDVQRRNASELRRRRIEEARALIREHLRTRACVDCGESDLVVLEFDHIGSKRGDMAELVRGGRRREMLLEELERCEVVCANCHRRRTAVRAGWRRLDGLEPSSRVRRCRSKA
jgi:hypothetical protein